MFYWIELIYFFVVVAAVGQSLWQIILSSRRQDIAHKQRRPDRPETDLFLGCPIRPEIGLSGGQTWVIRLT